MHWPHFLVFASDAARYMIAGGVLLAISAVAFLGDRRRMRRTAIDDVGLMPWRDIAALSTFAGLALLAYGGVGLLKG